MFSIQQKSSDLQSVAFHRIGNIFDKRKANNNKLGVPITEWLLGATDGEPK